MCDVVCVLRKDEDEEPKPFPEYICALTGRNGGSLEYIRNVIYFLRAVKANAIIKKSYIFFYVQLTHAHYYPQPTLLFGKS